MVVILPLPLDLGSRRGRLFVAFGFDTSDVFDTSNASKEPQGSTFKAFGWVFPTELVLLCIAYVGGFPNTWLCIFGLGVNVDSNASNPQLSVPVVFGPETSVVLRLGSSERWADPRGGAEDLVDMELSKASNDPQSSVFCELKPEAPRGLDCDPPGGLGEGCANVWPGDDLDIDEPAKAGEELQPSISCPSNMDSFFNSGVAESFPDNPPGIVSLVICNGSAGMPHPLSSPKPIASLVASEVLTGCSREEIRPCLATELEGLDSAALFGSSKAPHSSKLQLASILDGSLTVVAIFSKAPHSSKLVLGTGTEIDFGCSPDIETPGFDEKRLSIDAGIIGVVAVASAVLWVL